MGAACSNGADNSSPPVSSVHVGGLHDRRLKHVPRSTDETSGVAGLSLDLDADRASTLSLDEVTDSLITTQKQNDTISKTNYKQQYREVPPDGIASIDDVRVSVSQALGVDGGRAASRNDRAMMAKHDSEMRTNIQHTLGATIREESIPIKEVTENSPPAVPPESTTELPPPSPTVAPLRPESAPCLSQPASHRFTPPSNATPIPSSSSSASSSSIRSLSQASLMHSQEFLVYQMQLLQQQQQMQQQQAQPLQHVSFPQHLLSFGVQQRFARELELSMEELLSHPPNALSLLELPSARPAIPPARVAVNPTPSWSPLSTPRYSVADYAEDGTPIIEPAPPRRKLNGLMQKLIIEVLSNMTEEQREDLACARKKYPSHRAPRCTPSPIMSPKPITYRNRPATGTPLTPLCSPVQFPVGHTSDTPFPPQPVGEGLDVLEYRLTLLAAKIEWRELRRAPVPVSLYNQHANLSSAELISIASRQATEPPAEGGVLHFMREMNQSQQPTPQSAQPAPTYFSYQSWSPAPLHPLSFSPINGINGFVYPASATATASSHGSPTNSFYSLSHNSIPIPPMDSCVNSMSSTMQVLQFTGSPPFQTNTTAACYAHPLSLQNAACSPGFQYPPQPMMAHPLESNLPVHPLASHPASGFSMHSQGPSASPSSFQNSIQTIDCSHPLFPGHSHSHSQSFSLGHSQSHSHGQLHHGHSLSFDLHQPAHPLDTNSLHMQPTTTY